MARPHPYAATVPDAERSVPRLRREPPAFRRVHVARVAERSPRMRRLTLAGPELAGLPWTGLGASVRLLVPGDGDLAMPRWNGNEFLHPDGSRPAIRTLTPLRVATGPGDDPPEVDVDVVLHGEGPLSRFAATAEPGVEAALAGTGRGYEVDPAATLLVLAGDESALPAIGQVLEAAAPTTDVRALVEVTSPAARLVLPGHPRLHVTWLERGADQAPGAALVPAVATLDLPPDLRLWAAGEAAAMQRIRRRLFEDLGLPRPRCVVRGYWKRGAAGTDGAGGDGAGD
jgi:NADPH-dependent ferric siderophore reductase